MTHSPSASSGPRLPFAFAGQVTVWDPIQRHLEIGPLTCRMASRVGGSPGGGSSGDGRRI